MHISNWVVGKVGGLVLNSTEAVKRLPYVLRQTNVNILVVSAFYGQTRLLLKVCDTLDSRYFLEDFIDYHKKMVEDLGLESSFNFLFLSHIRKFNRLYNKMMLKDGSIDEESFRASVLAFGEDFSQTIVAEYLHQNYLNVEEGDSLAVVDARKIVATESGKCCDASVDQFTSKIRIQENIRPVSGRLFIVQGFIGSLATEPSRTTVLPLDGSDVTAALIAACLSTIEKPVSLVYFKRGDPDSLYGFSNARKLMVYMKESGKTIVSPSIFDIKGLPSNFLIRNYDDLDQSLGVSAEPEMLKRIVKDTVYNPSDL
ncbi:MAG: hypothetical protein R3B55_02310 [Candidatus Paceibacterota bacterium]